MIKNRILLFIIGIILSVIAFVFFIDKKSIVRVDDIIKDIELEFRGKIINKKSYRNGSSTHLEIKSDQHDSIFVIPPYNTRLINNSEIGDKIIKLKNENIIELYRKDSLIEQFYYIRISYKHRYSKKFPIEWRDKWIQSSRWDSLNKLEKL